MQLQAKSRRHFVMQWAPLWCAAFFSLCVFHFLTLDVFPSLLTWPFVFIISFSRHTVFKRRPIPFMSSDNDYTRTLGTFSNFSKRLWLMWWIEFSHPCKVHRVSDILTYIKQPQWMHHCFTGTKLVSAGWAQCIKELSKLCILLTSLTEYTGCTLGTIIAFIYSNACYISSKWHHGRLT